jgi:hypothetical protein
VGHLSVALKFASQTLPWEDGNAGQSGVTRNALTSAKRHHPHLPRVERAVMTTFMAQECRHRFAWTQSGSLPRHSPARFKGRRHRVRVQYEGTVTLLDTGVPA